MPKRNLAAYAKNSNISGLSHSETVIVLLLKKFPEGKIPESQVIVYYQKKVQRSNSKDTYGVWRDYTRKEIKIMAMQWFYRSIGKLVSRSLIEYMPTISI